MKYLIAAFLFSSLYLSAVNSITLTGIVTDATTGNPVAGASVNVKNQNIFVTTAADGRFSITVPEKAKILVCSFAGYEKVEIKIKNDGKPLLIKLKPADPLEEVVVAGIGQKKILPYQFMIQITLQIRGIKAQMEEIKVFTKVVITTTITPMSRISIPKIMMASRRTAFMKHP